MSWEIEKDVLYPGRVVVPGPDGKPRSYTFTPEDLARIERTANAKIRDRWEIPLAWEHQPVEPIKGRPAELRLSQAERDRDFARGVFGFAKGLVQRDGRLRVRLAGDDDADLKQFQKVRYVSPEIAWDWRDSDGKVWHGPTITHIAATPRPVQRHQDAVALSLRSRAPSVDLKSLILLGESTNRPIAKSGVCVAPRLRLSLNNYEGRTVADDLEINTDGMGGSKSKQSPWERIAAALEQHCGITLGDVSKINDPEMFATIVEVAAANYKAGQEPDFDDENPLPDDEDANAPPTEPPGDMDQAPAGTEQPAPPIQMSHVAADRIKSLEREKYVARAKRVAKSGSLNPADGDALVTKMETMQLSLTAQGQVVRNESIVELEALEKIKPGAAWKPRGRVKLSQRGTRPAARSPYSDEPVGSDEAAAKRILEMTGYDD